MLKGVLLRLFVFESFLTLVSSVPPRTHDQCHFPMDWEDIWIEPKQGGKISIVDNRFSHYGKCVLELKTREMKNSRSFILRNNKDHCFYCAEISSLDTNILSYKLSDCGEERDTVMLCTDASNKPWRYLYREQFTPVECPAILAGSHTLSYSEYDTASAEYLEGCGEPRSEVNSCHQRYEEDPQVTINLGNCPQGTLVHRTSLTQSLSCVGSWQSEGVMFMVSLGDVWEYWEPGEYKNSDKSFCCMAMTTDGLKIYMAQGFGSGCDGLGLPLSPYNGLRNFVMEKKMRLEKNCNFPSWLHESNWQIIIQGGTITNERTTPKEMMFNKSSSFNLMFGGEQFTQDYSCSKVLTETPTEAKFQLFSQSQCLGSYQCLQVTQKGTSVRIHLGAPTPHLEHSCVAPNFDDTVPFLKATLVKKEGEQLSSQLNMNRGLQKTTPSTSLANQKYEMTRKLFNLKSTTKNLERNILAKINNLNNRFMDQVKQSISEGFRKLDKSLT